MRKRIISLFAVLALSLAALPAFALSNTDEGTLTPAADNKYTVAAVCENDAVEVGDTVTVDVIVEGAAFNGVEAVMTYDASVFDFVDVIGNENFKCVGDNAIKFYVLDNEGLASGTKVASVTFNASCEGEAVFGFESATAGAYTDFLGNAVQANKISASVSVEKGARGVEYKINSVTLRDGVSNQTVNSIPDHSFFVDVNITNLSAVSGDNVVLAFYNAAGQFVSMRNIKVQLKSGNTDVFTADVANSKGDIAKIKAFVLSSLGNPIPLSDCIEVK